MNWHRKNYLKSVKCRIKMAAMEKMAKSNKSIYLIHGWEGGPDKDWFPWLSKKLVNLGVDVYNLSMPHPSTPNRKDWVKHLFDHIEPSNKVIIVAHSMGCIAALRYLEKTDTKINGIILVAPYVENEKGYKTVSSFFRGKLNWDKINKNCGKIYSICSDNDPYVSVSQCSEIKENTNAECKVVRNKGHFDDDNDITEIPEVLNILKKII